jgi:hypothetical protein
MKHYLFAFALLISPLSFADAWDNLTMEEAKAVVAELKISPYIFDYCDCCDHSGEYAASVHLLKVTGFNIIPSSWSEGQYAVQISYEVIAKLNYTAKGLNTKKLKNYSGDEIGELIYMNYTWVLNRDSKKAAPFFNSVDYSTYGDGAPCKKEFAYPTPKAVAKVSDDIEYAAWYEANVKK